MELKKAAFAAFFFVSQSAAKLLQTNVRNYIHFQVF